eukprot:CAMPEP_0169455854 /NCGR_PEP_ID=MMETSP1042-20121227/16041_1 /TAXON_ID=464988 /ORGANISM="Hemiselmis andersenii, Strain CCMP1180" /LENGTH=221 /DNA_ID=CAMNT_0009568037 /DNA_START=36 /DNA_END=698 /DNA_ORIENTATION=-
MAPDGHPSVYVSSNGLLEVTAHSGTEKETVLNLSAKGRRHKVKVISALPSRFPFVEDLALSGNLVTDTAPLGLLLALRHLDLSRNKIEDISPLEPCVLLQRLNLESNKLLGIPAFLGRLVMLETCLLAFNKLSSPTDVSTMGRCPALTEVSLASNPLMDLPGAHHHALSSLPRVHILDGREVSQAERRAAASEVARGRMQLLEIRMEEQGKKLLEIRDGQV